MKWTYIITQKIKAAVALGVVIGLVLVTNMINKNHFSKLHDSFASVYEDRLVVENLIYKLSVQLNNKKRLLRGIDGENPDPIHAERKVANDTIEKLIVNYETTYLTKDESNHFAKLKSNLLELSALEKERLAISQENQALDHEIEDLHHALLLNLNSLSDIQILEGKKLINSSDKIIANSNLALKIELVVLVVIGLIVQALVFASKPIRPRFNQDSSLN